MRNIYYIQSNKTPDWQYKTVCNLLEILVQYLNQESRNNGVNRVYFIFEISFLHAIDAKNVELNVLKKCTVQILYYFNKGWLLFRYTDKYTKPSECVDIIIHRTS